VILLARVESIQVSGRGTVVVPDFFGEALVRVGSPIQLRIPGGKVSYTYIASAEWVSALEGERLAFLLPPDIAKDDVPEGTEIWLTQTHEQNESL